MTGFFPRRDSTYDDERVESLISQLQRHPGAGRFAGSSAVKINVLIFGDGLELFREIIGLDAHGSADTFGVGIVVAVTTDIENQYIFSFVRSQFVREFFDLYARNYAVDFVFVVEPEAICDVGDGCDEKNFSEYVAGRLKSAGECHQKIMEEKT